MNPLRVIDSISGALKQLNLAGLALAVLTTAQAGVIVSEGFNYAGQSDNAAVNTAAFNGGTCLSGNWNGPAKSNTTGLTFSDLVVAGGCARIANGSFAVANRQLNVNQTGTIWGSFLLNSVSAVDTSTKFLAVIVSKSSSGADYDINTCSVPACCAAAAARKTIFRS